MSSAPHESALAEARRTWPDIHVAEDRFFAALARIDDGVVVNAADLYLALGCLEGDRRALHVLENEIFPQITPSVARVCKGDLEDVLQTTREKLLVGGPNGAPKLAQYTGQGTLLGWLRVVAVRDALAIRRLKTPAKSFSDATELATVPASAHLTLLRKTHAKEFKQAIEEAIALLSVADRNMLRMNLLDRMSIDDLASLFHIHRATAARRLTRARESVLDHVQARLKKTLGLSDSEASSLARDLVGHIDLTISRLLSPEAQKT